jgi:flagellar basal body-associated protein FliL
MFCLVSSMSWGQTALWTNLVENPDDGLIYKKFSTIPFTGITSATAEDPLQRSYKKGFKHGEWVEFNANGLVKSKSSFSYGKLVDKIKGDPVYVKFNPPFTVNLDPEDTVEYLQISMQVLTRSEGVAKDLEKYRPLIRNNLATLFSQQNSLELRASEGKEQLQNSALELVQSIVDDYGSGGEVENIFFTSFVMQ